MQTVKIRNCSKTYPGPLKAVQDFSLELNRGELVVLVGPSGCGKTTVLQMIAGLTGRDSGEILIDDCPLDSRENISMMFQDSALFPWLSARENIGFGLRKKGLSGGKINKLTESTAAQLQITDLLDRKVSTFSGGQKQRVALARALCREADLLLMDEPFSALDRQLRIELQNQVLSLCRRRKQTVLLVTHDQNEALDLADRIAVMKEGKIIQTGTPFQLIQEPENVFVAGFVGENRMNLWNQDERIMGVRPEHLHLYHDQDDVKLSVQITEVRCNGLDYRVYFDYCGQKGMMISKNDPGEPGSRTELGCSQNQVYYFDRNSGVRIR